MPSSRPTLSPAVSNCWNAYLETYERERASGVSDSQAYEGGQMAYRQAMPCLGEPQSVRDFIACVTYAMVLQLIPNEDGTKLLYAANVAAGSFRREAQEAKQAKEATAPKDANQVSEARDVASEPAATREAA